MDVRDLFRPERAALLALLSSLRPDDWRAPTACAGWNVHDVALHILGGDLSNVARRRDGFAVEPRPGEDLVDFVDRFNEQWVEAARRLSPRLVVELLAVSGGPLFDHFLSLDLTATGAPVTWAGPAPAPVWLDVAREYTERWLHQQHIRDAVGRPGLTGPRFLSPVLATFVHALPPALGGVEPRAGRAARVRVTGEAGGEWWVVAGGGAWALGQPAASADATVTLDQDLAWRLLTRGVAPAEAERRATLDGDHELARAVLRAVAIIG